MSDLRRTRPALELAADLRQIRGESERIGDIMAGMALLFAAVAALAIGAGAWLDAPLFGVSAGFAAAAALAFGFAARMLARARRAQAPVPGETSALPRRRAGLRKAA